LTVQNNTYFLFIIISSIAFFIGEDKTFLINVQRMMNLKNCIWKLRCLCISSFIHFRLFIPFKNKSMSYVQYIVLHWLALWVVRVVVLPGPFWGGATRPVLRWCYQTPFDGLKHNRKKYFEKLTNLSFKTKKNYNRTKLFYRK